ncbi:putative NRPS-like protein biosynthetic cluster [Purpureocillium takamizusanense]|uniref:NRPS-like protein biosynthetic cluster n=1 Tax=Purpureocillium takamizusanense TaxID=2060973 RepID=A0A9Q8QFQ5_9HYPO|nr:putative NRPS-like protein biosynthetic cluster [Purpureocillium takamizusanense]UNI18371.1 putative NRPS-like protein biosynthetic cluster [Purpureocillium takamizusanense]
MRLICNKLEPRAQIWSQLLRRVVTQMLDLGGELSSARIFDVDVCSSFQLERSVPHLAGNSMDQDVCIHHLVSRTASRLGSSVAICSWDGSMTYQELEMASDIWSRTLLGNLRLPPGTAVLHCVDASKWAVVAWLSIVKAGLVCVPQDTSTPIPRLQRIARSVNAKLVLCDEHRVSRYRGLVDKVGSWCILNAASQSELDAIEPRYFPSARDVAVIVFTSGSTGTPKGVVQDHGALARGILLAANALGINQQTRLLQFSSLSFDLSIGEMFMPLATGGCVCIPNPAQKLRKLNESIAQLQVTDAILTPTVAANLCLDKIPSLHTLSLGGELAPLELCERLMAGLTLNNIYGSTEGAVWDAVAKMSRANPNPRNIGLPIGSHLWITHPDNFGHLSPPGVPGEVCVQGPDISRGYLNMAEMTKDRFKDGSRWLPDAVNDYGNDGFRTLYRTGDLGKFMPNGTIELLGRRDRQMKFNGQRFELGEVEACLKRHVTKGSHVHVNTLKVGNKQQLVAYLSAGSELVLTEERAQAWVRAAAGELLDFMVPKTVVPLQQFPLTVTGKIDGQKLTRMGQDFISQRRATDNGHAVGPGHGNTRIQVEPMDSMTAVARRGICNYLEDVKGIGSATLRDNFLLSDVGIDSMDAPALAERISNLVAGHVPPSAFLKFNVSVGDVVEAVVEQGGCLLGRRHLGADGMACEIEYWKSELKQRALDSEPRMAMDTAAAHILGANYLGQSQGKLVLVTGATGFLGHEILRQLLAHPSGIKVVALVRGDDPEAVLQTIVEAARQKSWWKIGYSRRLRIWLGDLSKPRLGLGHQQWMALFSGFDHIVHNGATVNWGLDYDSLRSVNVASTHQLLCGLGQPRSTPRLLFVSGGYISPADETVAELLHKASGMTGYEQTKLVCEALIEHFNADWVRDSRFAAILKPGFIIGSTTDGVTRETDAIWRFVKACVDVGFYSDLDAQRWVSVAGVDQVAKLVLDSIFSAGNSRGRGRPAMQKVLNGFLLQDMWTTLVRLGLDLEPLQHERWLKAMMDQISEQGAAHPLYPLTEWLHDNGGFLASDRPVATQSVDGISPLAALFQSLDYLIGSGFISTPIVKLTRDRL